MLIYHFGSRDGLLVEVVRATERRQREVLSELLSVPGATPVSVAQALWRRLTNPALAPRERLFFELYGRALRGDPATAPLLDGIVEDWLQPLSELAEHHGLTPERARTQTRLGIAVVRGLLLDLLAIGDNQAVDEAMEQFISFYQRSFSRSTPTRSPW